MLFPGSRGDGGNPSFFSRVSCPLNFAISAVWVSTCSANSWFCASASFSALVSAEFCRAKESPLFSARIIFSAYRLMRIEHPIITTQSNAIKGFAEKILCIWRHLSDRARTHPSRVARRITLGCRQSGRFELLPGVFAEHRLADFLGGFELLPGVFA